MVKLDPHHAEIACAVFDGSSLTSRSIGRHDGKIIEPKVFSSHSTLLHSFARIYIFKHALFDWFRLLIEPLDEAFTVGQAEVFFPLSLSLPLCLTYEALRQFLRDKCNAVFYARLREINVQTNKRPNCLPRRECGIKEQKKKMWERGREETHAIHRTKLFTLHLMKLLSSGILAKTFFHHVKRCIYYKETLS